MNNFLFVIVVFKRHNKFKKNIQINITFKELTVCQTYILDVGFNVTGNKFCIPFAFYLER